MKAGSPTGMINGDVDHQFAFAGMNGIQQFAKLLEGGGFNIKLSERRIDSCEMQSRVRASKPSHAAVSCRCRRNGKKVHKATTKFADNEIQFGNQIAKSA